MSCAGQNARSSGSESRKVLSALTHARGCIGSTGRAAAGDAAPAVELQVDAGDELRLAAREVHARVGDVRRLTEAGQVHAFEEGAAVGCEVGVATVVQHVA